MRSSFSSPGPTRAGHPPTILFDRLRALKLPPGEYAILGSGPIAVHGLIETAHDLDVIVRGETWQHVKSMGEVIMYGPDETVDLGEGLTFGRSWGYGVFDIDALIDAAEIIEGLPFVQLDAVIEFKKIADRPKDREHLRSSRRVVCRVTASISLTGRTDAQLLRPFCRQLGMDNRDVSE